MGKFYYKQYKCEKVFDTSVTGTIYTSDYGKTASFPMMNYGTMYYIGSCKQFGATTYSRELAKTILTEYLKLDPINGYYMPDFRVVSFPLEEDLTIEPNDYLLWAMNLRTNEDVTLRQTWATLEISRRTAFTLEAGTEKYGNIATTHQYRIVHSSLIYGKTDYIGEVIAEDGTYPDDGQSGDYWYVKDREAIEFKARVNGAWVSTEPYVRAGGVWVKADVHPRADGAWK